MSRLVWFVPLIALLLACETPVPDTGIRIRGMMAASEADSVMLYQIHGLSRDVEGRAAVSGAGDSAAFLLEMDTLKAGWYYLGVAPNQLSQMLLKPGEEIRVSGALGVNTLITLPPAANLHWVKAEQAFFQLNETVQSTWKLAILSMDDGNRDGYLDYADLAIAEYTALTAWIDSLFQADPFLAGEFRLKLQPPFLPAYGEFTQEAAFQYRDDYFRAVLKDLGQQAHVYPGFKTGLEDWLDLQNRTQPWAAAALRDARIDSLLELAEAGTPLHRDMLATVVSVLDGWDSPGVAKYARSYLELYPGNRRMATYLEGRIKLMEDRIRMEQRPARTYGLE